MADSLKPPPDPAHLITQIHAEMKTLRVNQHQQVQGLLRLTELTKALDAAYILWTANAAADPVLSARIARKGREFLRRR